MRKRNLVKAVTHSTDRKRARLSFIGIVLLFVVPLLLAVGLYVGGWRPIDRVNIGELVDPPRDVSELRLGDGDARERLASDRLTGQWSVVHVAGGTCEQACKDDLHETRQVRAALGKDADRVKRFLLLLDRPLPGLRAELQPEHPDLTTAQLGGAPPWLSAGSVWLVDPLGNVILRYPPGYESRGLLKDLKRLLKLSKIG